ncbi:MAG: MraY family glycosyltransferase, partial [Erysipelotrichales bacterium]
GQIRITSINIPGGLKIDFGVLSTVVTMLWIIGITNAVNLIDGMDGLCAGVCSIILATIACLSYVQGRADIVILSILLLGATLGFLFFNFYPASIFMGDCGSLFLGYMISTISLLGFKSSAFLTLGPAIFMLAIPIMDTFLSIIRRKVKGVSISTPDKEHLHHTLMYKMNLTHMKTVLTIYAITFYFSQVAYVYLINKRIALIMLIIAAIAVELFVEKTSMISKKYRPILWLVDLVKTVFGKEPK